MKTIYRPEIDGLRAIAVVAVILYHAGLISGGFIGVDIFFVISGYLITSIIFKELNINGTLSFRNFYERRIRRILPVLLIVILVSFPFAWMYLIPTDFQDYSKSILYSLGFTSNFYFWYAGEGYGARSSLFQPFLHTWSLSIEEQFYIFFPIFFLVIYKYCKNYLLLIFIVCFALSLIIAEYGSENHPSFNFYSLPTRAWELLAGSILAFLEIKQGYRSKNNHLNIFLPIIGLLLIVHSLVFYHHYMLHPSIYTLSPIIGVSLIIWFSHKDNFSYQLLSSNVFVGLGLLSYSLYLWHYPIFAFARITDQIQGNVDILILIIISFLLSLFTFYFIEKPARNKSYSYKKLILYLISLIIFLIALNVSVLFKDGYKTRMPEILNIEPYKVLRDEKNFFTCGASADAECRYNTYSNQKIFIIGDSHMRYLSFDLKERVVKRGYQFIVSTLGGCLYYPGFDKVDIITGISQEECNNEYFLKLKNKLLKEENSIIIFGGRFPEHLHSSTFVNKDGGGQYEELDSKYFPVGKYNTIEESFRDEVTELAKKNQIVLVYPIPEVGWDVPTKLLNLLPKEIDKIDEYLVQKNFITTSYDVYKERSKSSFKLLDSIKGENIYRVYPHELFCNTIIENRCITHDEKNIFYADSNHPSVAGTIMINNLIEDTIKEINSIKN